MNSQRSHTYVRAVNNLHVTPPMSDGAHEDYWRNSGTMTSNHKGSPPLSPTYNANSLSRDGTLQQHNSYKLGTSPQRMLNGEPARLVGPSKAFTRASVAFELHGLRDPGKCRLKVVNPRDEYVPCITKRDDRGVVFMTFTGNEPGFYVIHALVDDQVVEGSPVTCELQDLSNIQCQLQHESVALGDTITLLVDIPKQSLKQLGPTKPLMSSEAFFVKNGRQEPCTVESFAPAKSSSGAHWKVLLRPQEDGLYEIRPMLNGCLLPESPYNCHVVDISKIRVNGPGLLKTSIGQDSWFQIHLPEDAPEAECHAFIYEPKSGTETKSKASSSKKHSATNLIYVCRSINNLAPVAGERELLCQYKAKMTGPHEVHVNYLNRPVPGSPWICHVFDASKVKLIQKPAQPTPIGQTVNYVVDCREAGRGDLQAIVSLLSSPDMEIPMTVRPDDESQHIIRCSFPAQYEGEHLVHISFNGKHIPGSPCSLMVAGSQATVMPPVEERVPLRSANSTLQKSMAPSSTASAAYTSRPLRVGVPSELRFHQMTNRPDSMAPEARPDDLRPAVPSDGLKAVVRGPYQETVPHQILVSPSRNAHLVEFCPRTVGEHQIEVFQNGQPVEGNPFRVRVYDPNKVAVSLDRTVPVGKEAKIRIDSREAGHVPLDVSVDPPPGHKGLDTHLRPTEGGFALRYWVFGYIPAEPGVYRIHIYYGDVPVPGSPFEQHAVGHSSSIVDTQAEDSLEFPIQSTNATVLPRVYGEGLTRALLGQKSKFVVDPKGQKGELFVQVEGPNSMAQCNIARDPANPNTYLVEYIPTEVGEYVIRMNWQNQPVEGSPFYTVVVAPDTVRCISDAEVHFREPIRATYLKQREIVFDTSQAGPGVLTGEVLDGKHLVVPSEVKVNSTDPQLWTLSFTPQVKGRYRVNVWWEGIRLPDCPITVEAFGPPGAEGSVSNRRSSRLYIQEQQQIPTTEPDHTKVILMGRGLRECIVGHPSEFAIDGHKAGIGRPRVTLSDSLGAELPINVFNEGHQRYTVSYSVDKPGSYFLNILWGDRHVRGTPFKVTARHPGDHSHGSVSSRSSSITNLYTQKSQARSPTPQENHILHRRTPVQRASNEMLNRTSPEPLVSGIRVWGDGLQEAVVNRVSRVFIDVSKLMESRGGMSTPTPAISAQCIGPRGVPALCEVKETTIPGHFEVCYTPEEAGTHELFLYCDGIVLRYCPYRVRVATTSDPNKVRVYGPGVEWGVLENFESRFICDTRGAGAGQLTVKIKGKQGAFRVELERENQQDRGIVCRYDPSEAGDYYITVKWSGSQVPGSPFHVRIFETAEEYENHMRSHQQPTYDEQRSPHQNN